MNAWTIICVLAIATSVGMFSIMRRVFASAVMAAAVTSLLYQLAAYLHIGYWDPFAEFAFWIVFVAMLPVTTGTAFALQKYRTVPSMRKW